MSKLPLDIVKNILSYDYRFIIRNGEIIVIKKSQNMALGIFY
jgi:hypothetical protein